MLIEKYTTKWVEDFAHLKCEIENRLPAKGITIEHVGSTSVPDLDSKPIIDMDIIYTERSAFTIIKAALEKSGYFHNGNQGIEGRDVFKRSGKSFNPLLDTITHHLYVCHINSQALERHILLRNYLQKNEWARLAYQQLKYDLANEANQDKKRYAQLKELKANAFIDLVIEKEKNKHAT